MITSTQNDKVKLVYGLQNRPRARRKERKIVLEGTRLIHDALNQSYQPDFVLYQPEKVDYQLIAQLQAINAALIPVNDEVMRYVSDTQAPQGIVAVFPMPMPKIPQKPRRVLILDSIREPGNMGTILRTAAAAGRDVIILTPDCVDPYNPKVLRSGMGAHFRVPILEAQWFEIKQYCESLEIYLATGNGDLRYDQVDWAIPHAVIIGNEAHGAGTYADEVATRRIFIPMAAQTESLNAAVAAGVILFEAAKLL
ncbi:MAG: RNA methyltransferase [Chloroflexi bacterium]|nr:MAG: RNA methyltransferase [Chloroflexota bacterium]